MLSAVRCLKAKLFFIKDTISEWYLKRLLHNIGSINLEKYGRTDIAL